MLKPAGAVFDEGLCHTETTPNALPEVSTAEQWSDAVARWFKPADRNQWCMHA